MCVRFQHPETRLSILATEMLGCRVEELEKMLQVQKEEADQAVKAAGPIALQEEIQLLK